MLQQNVGIRILAIFLITIVLFTGITVVLSRDAKGWEANVQVVSPTAITPGDAYVVIEIKVTNMGSHPMKITEVAIHLDWMDEGVYRADWDVSESKPRILGSGDSTTFYIAVPKTGEITTNTYHSYTVMILAYDPGVGDEWGPKDIRHYHGSILVEEEPTKVNEEPSSNMPLFDLIWLLLLIGVLAFVIIGGIIIAKWKITESKKKIKP